MPTLLELEPQVLALSESERLQLVSTLLTSLPPDMEAVEFYDVSDEEVLRRVAEAETDPSATISAEEFEANMKLWMACR